LPSALNVKIFDEQLVLEAMGVRSGKRITFDKQSNELKVAWSQRNPLSNTIIEDPNPLIIPLNNLQKLIIGRDEPGGNPILQDFTIKIQEDEEIQELLAGDSRLLRIARLISDKIGLGLTDETQLDPEEWGFEIPISKMLPESSQINEQQEQDVTTFSWIDKGDLFKYWGYFIGFTLFYAFIVLQFFSKDFMQLSIAMVLWFLIFRMVLNIPKIHYSKIVIAPTYIALRRTSIIEELETLPQIPLSQIESVRLTMVTDSKPGLEVVTKRAIHWIGYDISLLELGYLYSTLHTKMNIGTRK
ncbi:MAG: hypothetical protein ACFFCQ_08980, partial [Promethearchaeota archaeon]